jgi:hypothetical protein
METFLRIFLAIYLAHLLTDFVLQTHAMAAHKRNGVWRSYGWHALIHYITAAALTGFFVRGSLPSLRVQAILLALTAAHLSIDLGKSLVVRRGMLADGAGAYLFDQSLHLATVLFAAWALSPAGTPQALVLAWSTARSAPSRFLAVAAVYVLAIFTSGYLIRFFTRSLAEGVKGHLPEKSVEQLQNAGLYIGWLERFLVITALLLQSPATIGLLLAAKSIARYPEFKSERFAEYFLIGTLLSICFALIGGAIISRLLFGKVRLAG